MFALLSPARKRRMPSRRNLQIYDEIMLQGKTQQQAAADHKLSQTRISQIVASVEGWRACTAAAERGELPPDQKQRHELCLSQRRNDELYRRNLRAFDASEKPLTTTKTISECDPDVEPRTRAIRIETTVREQRPNATFLRNAFAANKELARQAELPVKPEPKPEENYWQEHELVNDWLWRQRTKAEDEGRVAKSAHPGCFVNNWLAVLLGDNPGILSPGFAPPGPAVKEVVRRFVLQRVPIVGDQPGGEPFVEEVLGEPIGANHPAYPGWDYPSTVEPQAEDPLADPHNRVNAEAAETNLPPILPCDYDDTGRFSPSSAISAVSEVPGAPPSIPGLPSVPGSSRSSPGPHDPEAPASSTPWRASRPVGTCQGGMLSTRANSPQSPSPPRRRPGFSIAAMEAEILRERTQQHLKNMTFKVTER